MRNADKRHMCRVADLPDALGRWATAVELCAGQGIDSRNCTKICRRATNYGLAEVDESVHPMRFKALAGWRQRVNIPHISTGKIDEKADAFKRARDRLPAKIINSVWSLSNA